jgi:glucokinase
VKAVLGVDFGGTKIAVAVCDLDGHCLAERVLATCPGDGATAVLGRGIAAGQALVARSERTHQLAGVGVSTIGVPGDNGVELAPAIPGWENVGLRRSLGDAFGVPVKVGTDVKAAASVEARWGALVGPGPAIYLNLGTGLGAAIVVGGQVLDGAHGASGEIGYSLVAPSHVGLGLGARPTLEDTVSGMGVAAKGSRLLGRPITANEVFGAQRAKGDLNGPDLDGPDLDGPDLDGPDLSGVVGTFIGELSYHLVNLAIAVDPARIAVGGGMAGSWGRLHPPLDQALKSGVPFPPDLVLATYPFDAPLLGALALGAEAAGTSLARAVRLHENHN